MNIKKFIAALSATAALAYGQNSPAPVSLPPPEELEKKVEEIIEVIRPRVESVARAVEQVAAQVGATIEHEINGRKVRLMQAPGPKIESDPEDPENPVIAMFGGPQQTRALIIRTTPLEPKAAEALQEDITVMSRILEKNLEGGKNSVQAMGIGVWALEGVLGRPARNLYIEGHGVIFMQDAPFPLVATSEPKEEKKEKEETSSAWEEARRELYGPKQPMFKFGSPKGAPFEQAKVNRLKDRTIEALQNAAHMKSIKPDEFITVVISGPRSAASQTEAELIELHDANNVRRDRRQIIARRGGSTESSTMTIRARKSDIDDFANEKLSLEEFKKKVKIAAY